MKVILTEKVASLGNVGEVVNVSAGHARNQEVRHCRQVLHTMFRKLKSQEIIKPLPTKGTAGTIYTPIFVPIADANFLQESI